MNGRIIARILAVIILVAVLAGAAVMVFNAGVACGLAAEGNFPVISAPNGESGTVLMPGPHYGYYGHRPFIHGWGFFPFGCLFPLLFFFLIFAFIRGLFFWGGPHHRHYGWGGPHEVPPPFEEWHRRAHESESKSPEENQGS